MKKLEFHSHNLRQFMGDNFTSYITLTETGNEGAHVIDGFTWAPKLSRGDYQL